MGELINWLTEHTSQTGDDDPFVLNFNHSDIDTDRADFQYVVSTPRLLKNAANLKILCADGTYKLNIHGYPVIVIGGIDIEQRFHLNAFSITTKEESANYEFLFRTIKETIAKLHQEEFKPEVLISDAAAAISKGFYSAFPDINAKHVTCWFHALKAMRAKIGTEYHEELIADINLLHHSSSEKVFKCAVKLFIEKWNEKKPEFCRYFQRYWVNANFGWYNGYTIRCPSTNNGIEGYNSFIKRCITFRELMPLGAFNEHIYRCLNKSSVESSRKIFPLQREITDTLWAKALSWNAEQVTMKTTVVSRTITKYYIASRASIDSGSILAIDDYENMRSTNFDDFAKLMFSLWRLELNSVDFHVSICTCPPWLKDGLCKHVVGTAIKLQLVKPPQRVNQKLLKMPLKRMPRIKAVRALTLQPNYAHAEPSTSPQHPSGENDTPASQIQQIDIDTLHFQPLASTSRNIDLLQTTRAAASQIQQIPSSSQNIDTLPTAIDTSQPDTPIKRSEAMKQTDQQGNSDLSMPSTPTTAIARSLASRGRKRVQMQPLEPPKVQA